MKFFRVILWTLVSAILLVMVSGVRAAEISVKDVWIRATVPGQSATGAFMALSSHTTVRLVGVSSPIAGRAEVHQMRLEQGVMKMQAIPALEVPAGQTVQLAPGAYHVMLMRLSKPVEAGAQIPMQLTFELANQKRQTVGVTATVRALNAQRGGDHGQHHNH